MKENSSRLLVRAACLFGLLALTVSAEVTELPRVFVAGDSISSHYGPHLARYLSGAASYDRQKDGDVAGPADKNEPPVGSGGDSSRVLAYLKARRAAGGIPADLFVFNCGLHDIKTDLKTGQIQVPLGRYEQNLRDCIAEARAMNLRVVWIRTTPVVDEIHNRLQNNFSRHARDVAAYNAVADRIMREADVPVIDLHGFSLDLIPESFVDHVHYDEAARKLQAAFISGSLRAILNQP